MRFLADFVVLSFAVFGFTYLIHYTDGPGDVFFRFRDWLMRVKETEERVYPAPGQEVYITRTVTVDEESFFYKLFNCFWCSSTWSAIIIVGLYYVVMGYQIWTFPFVALGTLGVSGFLGEILSDG